MLILLGMPVVQIILFGFAISTEVKNVRLAVLDPSNDVVTRKIIDRLDASEYFTVTARFHSPQEMEAAFLKNEGPIRVFAGWEMIFIWLRLPLSIFPVYRFIIVKTLFIGN